MALSDAKKRKLGSKDYTTNLFLETYNYVWFENEESADTTKGGEEESADLPPIPPLQGDEEVKERKGLAVLTPNKLLTKLPELLAQIKTGNNLFRQILHIYIVNTIKSPKNFTTI